MWQDLLAACALVLIIEGVMPFVNPAALRRAVAALIAKPDASLRIAGLISMIAGVILLYVVR